MNITSPEFAGYVLLVLLIYYFLPRRGQNILLLVASYVFLITWAPQGALVFALLTAVNFLLGQSLEPGKNRRQWFLWLGILVNIGALVYFKYDDFFVPYVVYYLKRAGISVASGALNVLLPVGLSFYIVQAISYLMDIYRGLVKPAKSWLDFAVYMAYFPRILSGPIERARDFLPKLEQPRLVDGERLSRSFTLLLTGLLRKIALADMLTLFIPKEIFSKPGDFSAPALTFWLLAYAFTIYNDFAGYTSIVRGISGFFGIELSANFNTPYFARNFTEFWQRWHITLSNWLRDYIFTPLTRALLRRNFNSRHPLTVILPPITTMFVSALWHGAGWSMLLWGGLHGIFQVLERTWAMVFPGPPPQRRPLWRQGLSMLLVFILAVLAWVPFRMDLVTALSYWKGMLHFGDYVNPQAYNIGYYVQIIVSVILFAITLVLDLIQYKRGEFAYLHLPPLAKALLINAALFIIILGIAARFEIPPPFIYQGF